MKERKRAPFYETPSTVLQDVKPYSLTHTMTVPL